MWKLSLKRRTIVFVGICCLILTILFINPAFAQDTLDTEDPPRLRALEYTAVQIVYFAWAFGGIFFALVLSYIGFIYMTSAGDPQKKEEAKGRAKSWMIGLALFFLAYPIISFAYDVMGVGEGNEQCYEELNAPGFHFFFPNTCTNPYEEDVAFRLGLDCPGDFTTIPSGKCCHNGVIFPIGNIEYNSSSEIHRYLRDEATGVCTRTYQCTKTGINTCNPAQYIYDADATGVDRIQIKESRNE